jgi:hypothetical protein
MPFNPPESQTYINIKLTDAGRRMLSLGQLQFVKAVVSDREINYDIDRSGNYDIQSNRVLAPVDDYPNIDPINLDGSNAIELTSQQVLSVKQFNTAQTATYGLFSGYSNAWQILYQTSNYGLGYSSVVYGSNTSNWGTNQIVFGTPASYYLPKENDLVYITWVPDQYSGTSGNFPATASTGLLVSGAPFNGLWYKIISADTTPNTFYLDRPIPDLSGASTVGAYFYPNNAIEGYFGSASTQSTKFWNMNITRTSEVLGTIDTNEGVSGYSSYGSIEYAGTKHYLGFDEEYPALGIIHYSNRFSGQTYGEQLIEKSVQIHMPQVMWHRYPANNGQATAYGLILYDLYGTTMYDAVAKTTYRDLRDGIQSTNKVVGRVYHKLQLFVIYDQDLLMSMSYKGNRNFTLPEPLVSLVSNPKAPLTTGDVTGLCESGKTYFVSYLMESNVSGSDSFGFTNPAPCGYIKQIDGQSDINGNPQYLSVQFPTNSFPYMRTTAAISATGTGWNAQRVKILINEQDITYGYKPGNVPSNGWVVMSGQGIFDCTTANPSTTTIDPVALNSYQFVMSREDYLSGATNGNFTLWSGHTSNGDYLTWGDEAFFFGNIDAQVFNTLYKTIITVVASNYEFNQSNNDSYSSLNDEYTYITEIAILDSQNQTVAIGKPTYPLRKSNARYLAFQLQIDF